MSNTNRPQAWIVSPRDNGRRAIKHRNGKQVVFLKDKEEYGFELYNPTSERYAVSIDIDGKPISTSMIVLEPGLRQYLNCYIDSKRKFVFSTYEVEDTQEVDRSIENNGKVDIRFHRENVPIYNTITYPYIYCGSTGGNTSGNYIPSTTTNLCYSSNVMPTSVNTIDVSNMTRKTVKDVLNSFETTRTTGRTTQGEMTDTVFNDYHGSFNYYASYTTNYWIEPDVNIYSRTVTDDWLREQLSVKFVEDLKKGDYDKARKEAQILTENLMKEQQENLKKLMENQESSELIKSINKFYKNEYKEIMDKVEGNCDKCNCGENKCESDACEADTCCKKTESTDFDVLEKKLNILERLKYLNREGILTDSEYNNKRADIVSKL